MNAQYTKGPWNWNKNGTITDESGKKIAYTHLEENNANHNTRLIASAPAMYEALKEANEMLNMHFGLSDNDAGVSLTHDKIRAAISAAEGRE